MSRSKGPQLLFVYRLAGTNIIYSKSTTQIRIHTLRIMPILIVGWLCAKIKFHHALMCPKKMLDLVVSVVELLNWQTDLENEGF